MSMINRRFFSAMTVALGLVATPVMAADVEVRFYYPVAVGGPVTKIIDEYAASFEKDHPGIKIKPVYAGDYVQTLGKALTAVKGGDSPELAIPVSYTHLTLPTIYSV